MDSVDYKRSIERSHRVRLQNRPGAIAAAFVGALLSSACSPYRFTENAQAFSTQIASINAAYQEGAERIADEKRTADRIVWMRDRPLLGPGPGCITTSGPVPCEVIARNDRPTQRNVARPRPALRETGAPATQPCGTSAAVANTAADGSTPLTRAGLLRALDNYSDGLAALTRAQDRAAFDNAAGKVSAAAGNLARSAATFSGPPGTGPAAGSLVEASTDGVLWVVGAKLDQRRLRQLRKSTEEASPAIRTLAPVLGEGVLFEQRDCRLTGLRILLELKIQAANMAGSVKDPVYGAAVDEAQAAAAAYESVRAANPRAAAQALSTAHDELATAVRNDDGQFADLAASIEAFSEKAKALVAAASASPKPAAPKS